LQVAAAERNARILQGFLDFIAIPIRAVTQLGIDAINGIATILNKIPGVNIPISINGNPIDAATGFLTSLIFDPKDVADKADEYSSELQKNLANLENQRAGDILSGRPKGGGTTKEKQAVQLEEFNAFYKAKADTIDQFAEFEKGFEAEAALALDLKKASELLYFQETEAALAKKMQQEQEEAAISQQIANEKIQAYQNIGFALNALGDLVGRQTAAGKALAIAQAVINTWLGVTQVLANKTLLPEPLGTINKVASIAGIVAAGIGAVRNIAKTNVPGGGGGGGASAGAISAPSIPRPQQQTTSLDRNSLNQIGSAASRAFVVESDVSSSQERIRRLNRAARLG